MKTSRLLCTLCAGLLPIMAWSNPYADNLAVRLLPGWQQNDGSHIAALEMTLKAGWKTYWRAPGDAGVPPVFSWTDSQNVARVQVIWPKPEVFLQNGMQSIGYSDRVILPLRVEPVSGGAVELDGHLLVGICEDICVPLEVDLMALTLPETRRRVPAIAAALAERPFSGKDAGMRKVTCEIEPAGKRMNLRAVIDMPSTGGTEVVVLETRDPSIWVSEAKTHRIGNQLTAEAQLVPMAGGAIMLDRSGVNLTVIGDHSVVEISGCPAK